MRRAIAIALVSAGCKGLLGIDDVLLVDAASVDGVVDVGHDAPLVPCPSSYDTLEGSGSSYRRSGLASSADWLTAAKACAADTDGARTHLAVPTTASERALLSNAFDAGRFWIGLSERSGPLQWVTAEPAPVPGEDDEAWQTGEPDGPLQACVRIEKTYLADDNCDVALPYLCECDAYPNDPSRY